MLPTTALTEQSRAMYLPESQTEENYRNFASFSCSCYYFFLNIVGGNKNTCSSVFHPTIPEWSFFLISLSIRKVLITLIPLYLFKIASVAFIGVKKLIVSILLFETSGEEHPNNKFKLPEISVQVISAIFNEQSILLLV